MKLKIKATVLALLGLATITFMTGCGDEKSPYETNDSDKYSVSVKYDANGGTFTTNTSVIVDSYNIDDLKENKNGQAEIALLSPDDSSRENDAFKATKNGHFLAGWYTERTESTDEDGNTVYSYSGKWDFENDLLEVDPTKEYSAKEPVLTLYAAWVPLFEIEFYSFDSGEYMDGISYDPTVTTEIQVPAWDEETGILEMYQFPEKKGYTFNKAYYDKDGQQLLDTVAVHHPGIIDYETGTAQDTVLKLYVDWTEGEWFHIYNTEQFLDNASVNGNYEIYADLDFEGEIWPTSLMYGNYTGTIKGNGHTMKNIELTQTNNSKVNAGLFGYLTETANISDLTFENVTFTIKSGTRVVGTSYGIFAGTISKDAILYNVKLLSSTLQISSESYFGVDDYTIGLVCGMGDATTVDSTNITCTVVGNNPESLVVTVNGNAVTVDTATE